MALGKTIPYTGFNKTSFGYGAGEIAAAHSSLTDVRVVIGPCSDNLHWDATGHLSTTSVGSAVPTYDKLNNRWAIQGTVADVDAVLDILEFFPADYPTIRNWASTHQVALKPNATNGNYIQEEPADTVAIPDTKLCVSVYDANNLSASPTTYTVILEPVQPTFGKQRPYWSIVPPSEDASTTAHGTVAGGSLDIGTVLQGSDTDPINIKCEFRSFGSTSQYTGTAYGQFTPADDIYIGDKKPSPTNLTDKRVDFTGSLTEVQAYFDNIKYYRMSNETAFDMYFTVTNGVVGSTLTKHMWFSDATIGLTTLPSQTFTEEGGITAWDFGLYTTSNVQPDADNFFAEITLDAVGVAGVSNFGIGTGHAPNTTWDGTKLTIESTSENLVLLALRDLEFTPEADFNTSFNMTVVLKHTGSVSGATYTSTPQTIAVTGVGVAEISNPTTPHTYVEDTIYDFSSGSVPQIIHPNNDNWLVTFTVPGSVGWVWPSSSASQALMVDVGSGVYTLTGTKTECNTALAEMQFGPNSDLFADVTIGFTVDRTSGNLEHETQSTGSYSMTSTDVADFTTTPLTGIVWEEDVSKTFNSGLIITDIADETVSLPAYGSTYTVECEMYVQSSGTTFTDGTLVSNTLGSMTPTGNGQGSAGKYVITGTKTEVNAAIADLKFIPNVDYYGDGPYVWYKLIRNSDSVTLADNNAIGATRFNVIADSPEFSYTTPQIAELSWDEDTPLMFDFGVQITDKADENSDYSQYNSTYTASLQLIDWSTSNPITTASLNVLSSITGLTIVVNSSGTTIQGTKTQVNLALQNLKMIPDMDWLASPTTASGFVGYFFTWLNVTRDSDSVTTVPSQPSGGPYIWQGFLPGTDSTEYYTTVTGMTYDEDTSKTIFNGLNVGILDAAADNFPNITYEVILKLSDSTAGEWTGTGSHIKTITGTKAVVNAAIQALEFTPVLDGYTNFNILYSQSRYVSTVLDTGHVFTDIDIGTVDGVISPLGDYYTSASMTYDEDTPKTIFSGKNIGVTDIAADNYADITYEVIMSLSDDGNTASATAGEWTGTGSHIKTITGTKAVVNAAIQALEFAPTLDYSTDFYILYTQKRYISAVLDTTHVSDINVGTVVGTASPLGSSHYDQTGASIPGALFTEDVPSQYIFSGHDVGITDIAGDNYPGITYEVTFDIVSATQGTFDSTGTITVTLTGTKAVVNAAIQNIIFTPAIDYDSTLQIWYTQIRHVSGGSSSTQVNHQITAVNATGVPEFSLGTANSNLQYMVSSNQTAITSGQVLSPKNLTENWSKTYERPITITDTAVDGGTTNYKIVFTVPSGTTLYDNTDTAFAGTLDWDTKANIHAKLDEGIRISGATADITLAFTLYRKLGTNVEDTLATGTLTYLYFDVPDDIIDVRVDLGYPIGDTTIGDGSGSYYPNYSLQIRPLALGNNDTLYLGSEHPHAQGTNPSQWYFPQGTGSVIHRGLSIIQIREVNTGGNSHAWTTRPHLNTGAVLTVDELITDISMSSMADIDQTFHSANVTAYGIGSHAQLQLDSTGVVSGQVYNRDIVVSTMMGTQITFTNIDINLTGMSNIDMRHITHSSLGVPLWPPSLYSYRKTNDTYDQFLKQSGYHPTTGSEAGWIVLDNQIVKSDGTLLSSLTPSSGAHTTNALAHRELTYASPDTAPTNYFERALSNGPQGYTYGFWTSKDTSHNRFINVIAHEQSAANQPSTTSYQITDLNAYGSDVDDVSITQIVYDSVNNDIYCLVMAENGLWNKYATIVKLDYNTGTSTYTWSTVKTISLGGSSEYYSIEAFLTDDYSRLITIQSQYNNLAATGIVDIDSNIYTGENRIRVHDKDTGGTNIWGLTATTNYSTSSSHTLTKKKRGLHDVNYGDINGSDVVITNFGHIFEKDEGGTDNWGRSGQLDVDTSLRNICHFTNNYIVSLSYGGAGNHGVFSQAGGVLNTYNKTTFDKLTISQKIADNLGWEVSMIETSRNTDAVGVHWLHKYDHAYDPNTDMLRYSTIINLTT